jgi:hypothetical protein
MMRKTTMPGLDDSSLAPIYVDGIARCRGCRTVLFWLVHTVATPPYVTAGRDVLLVQVRRGGWGVRPCPETST